VTRPTYARTVDDLSRVFAALHPTITVDGAVASGVFEPQAEHRGNPGWLHGGMAATVLDHVCARAASAALGGVRVVTGTLDLRYPRPVSIAGGPYRLWAEHDRARGRIVRVRGAILGTDDKPMVEAKAMFVAM
jgi:acyl-coenzyme A thioesterase PaaI-like protein